MERFVASFFQFGLVLGLLATAAQAGPQPSTQIPPGIVEIHNQQRLRTVFVPCSVDNPFEISLETTDKQQVQGSMTPLKEILNIANGPWTPYLTPAAQRAMFRFAYATDLIANSEQISFTLAIQGPIPLRLPEACGGDTVALGGTKHWSTFDATLWEEAGEGEDKEEQRLELREIDTRTDVSPRLLKPQKGDLQIDHGIGILSFSKTQMVPYGIEATPSADRSFQLCGTPVTLTAARVSLRLCHNDIYDEEEPDTQKPRLGLDLEDVMLIVPGNPAHRDKPKRYHLGRAFLDGKGLHGHTVPPLSKDRY